MLGGHRHLGARVSLDKVDKKLRLRAVRKLDSLALRAMSLDVLSPLKSSWRPQYEAETIRFLREAQSKLNGQW